MCAMMRTRMKQMLVEKVIPPLSTAWRKGQHGRVGIVGGSVEYTGAPYYAGMACLKTGADLCHIFCTQEAATPLKSYSPELIVHPLLRSDASFAGVSVTQRADLLNEAADKIAQVFSRLDVLVLGPGLGRDAAVQELTKQLVQLARVAQLPLVLDGDALFIVSQEPALIQGYTLAVLTPNAMEYARLCLAVGLVAELDVAQAAQVNPSALSEALGHPVILQKGSVDCISDGINAVENDEFGCPRRCGGQGDVLSGAVATFVAWTKQADTQNSVSGNPLMLAALGGSLTTRASASVAFESHGRAMTTPDILHRVGLGFCKAFP